MGDEVVTTEGPNRTHCACGHPLIPKPEPGRHDLGWWVCTWCPRAYCDVCGKQLDERDECPDAAL